MLRNIVRIPCRLVESKRFVHKTNPKATEAQRKRISVAAPTHGVNFHIQQFGEEEGAKSTLPYPKEPPLPCWPHCQTRSSPPARPPLEPLALVPVAAPHHEEVETGK